jgi:hypothetical protein
MATSGQGEWCVFVKLDKAPDIKVYFLTEDEAIAANMALMESLEAVRAGKRTIAVFNGGRQSVEAKKFVSSEVLPANRVPGGVAFAVVSPTQRNY